MAQLVTRRAVLVGLGAVAAGSVLGVGYVFWNIFDSSGPESRYAGGPGGRMTPAAE